jgi:7-cyano-7-deazaguanine synthase
MEVRLVIFFDYGQRALERERNAVFGAVNYYGFPLREVRLGWLDELVPAGMRRQRPAADPTTEPRLDTPDAVWVPNRNGVFLNIGAAYAEAYGCDYVVTGFNREEAIEFPDNGEEYVSRVNGGLEISTRNRVRVVSFTQDLDKQRILELGVELRAPLSVVWSCYHDRQRMCGRCASCRRLKKALAGVDEKTRPRLDFEG